MILAYRILTTFIYPFLIILLFYRILLKKEDAKRYKEKFYIKNFDIKKKIPLDYYGFMREYWRIFKHHANYKKN